MVGNAHAWPGETTTSRSIASLLAPTLGWEKSSDAVAAVMRRLCIPDGNMSTTQGLGILDELSHEVGIVGVTARFARARVARAGSFDRAKESVDAPPSSRTSRVPAPTRGPTLPMYEIATLLAHAMGQEKSQEALLAGARRIGLPEDRLDRTQASALFEDLAKQEGLVGISARFAKARLFLKFGT